MLKTSWRLALAHYLLTKVEVDGPDGAPGLLVLEVLQDIGLPAQTSTSQHKPTPLPGLEEPISEFMLTATFLTHARSSTLGTDVQTHRLKVRGWVGTICCGIP